jgi:hypothetical protein
VITSTSVPGLLSKTFYGVQLMAGWYHRLSGWAERHPWSASGLSTVIMFGLRYLFVGGFGASVVWGVMLGGICSLMGFWLRGHVGYLSTGGGQGRQQEKPGRR